MSDCCVKVIQVNSGGAIADGVLVSGTYDPITAIMSLVTSNADTILVTGITGQNVFNVDGALTGPRTVDMAGNDITWQNGGDFIIDGKLTVTGLIDPTGMQFSGPQADASMPIETIYITDGSLSGLPSGSFIFKDAGGAYHMLENTNTVNKTISALAPTVNDDSTAGIEEGDMWVHTGTTPSTIYLLAEDAAGAAVWQEQVSVANDRVFISDTVMAPAVAGAPTAAEALAAAGAVANVLVYYNGTDVGNDVSTYAWHVDNSGNFTQIEAPSAAANSDVFLTDTAVAPALAGAPTATEALAAAGGATDVIVYYNGTDVDSDNPTYAWHIGPDNNATRIEAPSSAALPRVFITDTVTAPALAGAPTTAEALAAAGPLVDVLVLYNGTDLETNNPTYAWLFDSAGDITLIERPSSGASLVTFMDRAGLSAADYQRPTDTEVQLYATAQSYTDRVLYYTETNVSTDPVIYAYYVDSAGTSVMIQDPPNQPRAFADDTTLSPLTAGAPTLAEVVGYVNTATLRNTILYYTGDDTSANVPTYVWHVDNNGQPTLVYEPSGAANQEVFITNTSTAPALAGNPTVAEATAAIGGVTDRIIHYNGTDVYGNVPTHVWHVDSTGTVVEIRNTVNASNLYGVDGALSGPRFVDAAGNLLRISDAVAGAGGGLISDFTDLAGNVGGLNVSSGGSFLNSKQTIGGVDAVVSASPDAAIMAVTDVGGTTTATGNAVSTNVGGLGLYFRLAGSDLLIDGDPGLDGQFLSSKGTNNAPVWADGFKDRLHVSATALGAAIPSAPTDAEMTAYSVGNLLLNETLYYTGTDVITDPDTHAWIVDNAGDITRVLEDELASPRVDASAGAQVYTLPPATGAGVPHIIQMVDGTNSATVAVPVTESLNGVLNGTYTMDTQPNGTSFLATDDGVGNWRVIAIQDVSSATFTEVALESIQVYLSATTATVADGTVHRVPFDAIFAQEGAGLVRNATGTVTLLAGRRYHVSSSTQTTNQALGFLYDFTNNAIISPSLNTSSAENQKGGMHRVITPVADMEVGVAFVASETMVGDASTGGQSSMLVEEIAANRIVVA